MELQHLHAAILELLSDRPSEVGARLKQRLNRTLLIAGLPAFDQKKLGYRKFTEFLVAELGEHLLVEKPTEGGDIQITLKHPSVVTPTAPARQSDTEHSSSAEPPPVPLIRGDIWQAFTHLNEHRKRYLDKASGTVLHFLDSEAANVALVAEAPDRFVEISRIEAGIQLSWIQQFLAISSFPDAEAATLAQLLEQPYSSQLSVLFGRALGKRQPEWKRYRAERVAEVVKSWAAEHEIPLKPLLSFKFARPEETTKVATLASFERLSPRERAQRLLAQLTEQEIVSIAIPALLDCVLADTRL